MQTALLPKHGPYPLSNAPRAALNRLRSRQEESELRLLLSFTAYDSLDQSTANRIYLVYLILYLAAMGLGALLWMAQGGAVIFSLFPGFQAQVLAVRLSASLLLGMALFQTIHALRLSPLAFSDDDRYQLCLQPLPSVLMVLRWFLMPWLKALLPSLPLFILIGFVYAESILPAGELSSHILQYFSIGLGLGLKALPWQLLFYILAWAAGLFALQRRGERVSWLPGVLLLALLLTAGVIIAFTPQLVLPPSIGWFLSTLLPGTPFNGGAVLALLLLIAGSFLLLAYLARQFIPLRAAEESAAETAIKELSRMGFTSAAASLKAHKRLGIARASRFSPTASGWRAYLAKAWLRTRRSFGFAQVLDLGRLGLIALGVVLAPSIWLRVLAVLFWSNALRSFALNALRTDLSQPHLSRLTPVPMRAVVLADLLIPFGLNLLGSLALVLPFTFLLPGAQTWLVLLLPGMLASIYLTSALVLLKRAKTSAVLQGTLPDPALQTTLLAALAASIPLLLVEFVPASIIPAFLASMLVPGLLWYQLR